MQSCNPRASIFYSKCDVTNKSNLAKAFHQDAVKCLGSIDILVNSAGILNESDPAGCVAVNLVSSSKQNLHQKISYFQIKTGLIDCTLTAMKLMSTNNNGNGGIVVNISSIAGLEPLPFCVTYCATKFGIVGFTRSMGVRLLNPEDNSHIRISLSIATNYLQQNWSKSDGNLSRSNRNGHLQQCGSFNSKLPLVE